MSVLIDANTGTRKYGMEETGLAQGQSSQAGGLGAPLSNKAPLQTSQPQQQTSRFPGSNTGMPASPSVQSQTQGQVQNQVLTSQQVSQQMQQPQQSFDSQFKNQTKPSYRKSPPLLVVLLCCFPLSL
jgi:hypothetical protein